jgi:hypothetical protein
MDIVELIYRPEAAQGQSKDYEFSHATMEHRWNQGLADARTTLARAPWLAPAPADVAVRTFDVPAGKVATAPNLKTSVSELEQQRVGTHG